MLYKIIYIFPLTDDIYFTENFIYEKNNLTKNLYRKMQLMNSE